MALAEWWNDAPGLRGIFPTIVQAASEQQTTAQVWQSIRDAADTASAATLSITLGRDPTGQEIADNAALMLKGVGILQVNQARALAGQMVEAHGQLSSASPDEQITAAMIGTPPWATTVNAPGVQTQYRISVQREIVVHGFTDITRVEWGAYNLTGPLTNAADAITQANGLFSGASYNRNVEITQVLDYSIEAI